ERKDVKALAESVRTVAIKEIIVVKLNQHSFFQAEDGIRDRNVTGVQTCALPIFVRLLFSLRAGFCSGGVTGLVRWQGVDGVCAASAREVGMLTCRWRECPPMELASLALKEPFGEPPNPGNI